MDQFDSEVDRQIDLEDESTRLGAMRYRRARPLPWRNSTSKESEEATLPPGKQLLKRTIEPVAAAIDAFLDDAANGTAGRRHSAVNVLALLDPIQAAYITARCVINGATRQVSALSVAINIANAIKDHIDFTNLSAEAPGLYRSMSRKMAKAGYGANRRRLIQKAMEKANVTLLNWHDGDKTRVGMKLIEIMVEETGLFEMVLVGKGRRKSRYFLKPTDELAEWLEKQHARCELLCPVHLPMVVPPKRWTTPYSGGYLTSAPGVRLVKSNNRDYLDELGNVDMSEVYKAVNHIQETPWRVNKRVLEVIREVWDGGGSLGALPPREDIPLPPKPADIESNEEALKHWKGQAARVYDENARLRSKRLAMSQRLWVAEKFADEPAIYFPHELDFRGRVYPRAVGGPHPQADDAGKALLEFAEGKPLGPSGVFWLAVHLANLFGVDKVSFSDRVDWVIENEEMLLDSAHNPLDGERFWTTADDPYCALSACFEYAGYADEGDDYVSHLPIALDGSNSGLQHFSAALRDPIGGRAVNLLPADQPQDIYAEVARKAQEYVDACGEPEAVVWKGEKVTRKIAKRPCMTYCYSSTRYGTQGMIEEALRKIDAENAAAGEPPHLNGADNYEAAKWLSHVIYRVIGETVVAAQAAMDWLRAAAKLAASEGLPLHWSSPVGFPVLQEYKTARSKRENVFFGGQQMKITVASFDDRIDKRAQANGIAPNWVHSLDAAHLMLSVNACKDLGIDSVAVIHDSFGTHAGDTSRLAVVLRQTFIDQYSNDVLTEFKDQLAAQLPPDVADRLPPLPAKGNMDLNSIRESDFIFA